MGIVDQKKLTLKNIIASYEDYKGSYLNKLKTKLSKMDLSNKDLLIWEFIEYADYLLNIIAGTQKVFVKLDKEFNLTAEEYNKVFEDLD